MTTPGGVAPEGAYVPGTQFGQQHQGMGVEEAKAYLNAPVADAFAPFEGFLPDLVKMIAGNYQGDVPPFIDGQLALNERFDLLSEVSGYCSTYQDKNWRVSGGGAKRIPFGKQLGPHKNAHPGDDGIYLDAPGTWRIDATATVSGGNGSGPCRFIISVRDPQGDIYSEQWLDARYMSDSRTWAWNTTVVIPEPGYHVRVYWGWGSAIGWWYLLGGTHRSRLTVNRWDIDPADFVPDTDVPDGGDLT